MKKHGHGNQTRSFALSNFFQGCIKHNTIMLGIASLIWLIIKSGRKPSRMQYPCQKAAASYVGFFLLPLLIALVHKAYYYFKAYNRRSMVRSIVLAAISMGLLFSSTHIWDRYQQAKQSVYYIQLKSKSPFGKKTMTALGISSGLLTIPHAMALPSPHRVVSVHHSGATNWEFACTGSGSCPVYYGDSDYVDQSIVNQMFDKGMQTLTDTDSTEDAWQMILPDYQNEEIVAIKVNFNDSIMGGGTSGYGDDDAYVDALPQVVNAVISGLITRGVAQENIRIFDSSRHITDRFRNLIAYPNVTYYDRSGNGDDVNASTFDSAIASASIDFSNSGYPASSSTHKITDVLIESDYLINIPIMKRHGGAGITLSLKNHLGSINGFVSGGHTMHRYFYLNGSQYDSTSNPIVDINANTQIKDKTVLIIGDGLYAGWSSNNTPPQRWDSFNNDSPNMLFFAADPVAADSVMFDYLDMEGYVRPASEDIMIVAANSGLGVHERWNNNEDREYTAIDYVPIDLDLKEIADRFGRTDCSSECIGQSDGDDDIDGADLAFFAENY